MERVRRRSGLTSVVSLLASTPRPYVEGRHVVAILKLFSLHQLHRLVVVVSRNVSDDGLARCTSRPRRASRGQHRLVCLSDLTKLQYRLLPTWRPTSSMNRKPTLVELLVAHRQFFAKLIAAKAGISGDGPIVEAFATTRREDFVGPAPWKVSTPNGYIDAPTDDPIFLYQDIVVALSSEQSINNGQPALHAECLAA